MSDRHHCGGEIPAPTAPLIIFHCGEFIVPRDVTEAMRFAAVEARRELADLPTPRTPNMAGDEAPVFRSIRTELAFVGALLAGLLGFLYAVGHW